MEGIGELKAQVGAGILGPANLHAAVQLRRPARRYKLVELFTACEGNDVQRATQEQHKRWDFEIPPAECIGWVRMAPRELVAGIRLAASAVAQLWPYTRPLLHRCMRRTCYPIAGGLI